MSYAPAPIIWQALGVPVGDEGRYGIEETLDQLEEIEVSRSWIGRAMIFTRPYDKLIKISWSASNDAIQFEPAWDNIQPGQVLQIYCLSCKTTAIPAGQASVATYYPIVPGSIVKGSLLSTGQRVPLNVAGNTVSLQSVQGDMTMVYYRPSVLCVVRKWSGGASQLKALQTWRAEFEEYGPHGMTP